ncbi:MAG: 16S rRNA (adenine(1518)-N(6)/adenine(1519)-N(6))-dimethyltransferase RsmA [Planctomycetes bacterium]|nr:16S rRNA (adenine(1518)-N(6)/adenine(1519)-N(6))-dimethyltransferase RsmA [Planctomycetota bacterium]
MPQTLTQIKTLLEAHGLRPQHRHGQNFLHDANQIRKILAAAQIQPGELVLEVGPGTGALSEGLLDAGARLVAVEIDHHLAPILQENLAARYPGRVNLIIADVLEGKHEINPLVLDALKNESSFKLIANLPYHVASPLLANLVTDYPAMSMAVIMIQREVAQRLSAPPGGKDYGPLGVTVQALGHCEIIATLPASCFWPQPDVESAVLRWTRSDKPLTDDPRRLARLLHTLFSKRRKQIGSILGRDAALPPGVLATQRPEQLTVEQLVALSRLVDLP